MVDMRDGGYEKELKDVGKVRWKLEGEREREMKNNKK
jgi:hypothetical protein